MNRRVAHSNVKTRATDEKPIHANHEEPKYIREAGRGRAPAATYGSTLQPTELHSLGGHLYAYQRLSLRTCVAMC